MISKVILLAAAGAFGALARVGLSSIVQRHSTTSFPWGTLVVNMTGCFLFGFVWSLAEERMAISPATRTILLAGFLGAFTTFSSFAYENAQLIRHEHWMFLAINLVVQNVLGVALMFAGMAMGRTGVS